MGSGRPSERDSEDYQIVHLNAEELLRQFEEAEWPSRESFDPSCIAHCDGQSQGALLVHETPFPAAGHLMKLAYFFTATPEIIKFNLF